jgi:ribosomal protein L12E/L44/L45/RPP1/RPP2
MLYAAKLEGKPVKEVSKDEPVVVLEKKPRSEKQIEATKKAAETRKRKREEKEESARLELESKQYFEFPMIFLLSA